MASKAEQEWFETQRDHDRYLLVHRVLEIVDRGFRVTLLRGWPLSAVYLQMSFPDPQDGGRPFARQSTLDDGDLALIGPERLVRLDLELGWREFVREGMLPARAFTEGPQPKLRALEEAPPEYLREPAFPGDADSAESLAERIFDLVAGGFEVAFFPAEEPPGVDLSLRRIVDGRLAVVRRRSGLEPDGRVFAARASWLGKLLKAMAASFPDLVLDFPPSADYPLP